MKKILYKLSLRYHYPMRSDNLNNVMKLNRFLANPLIIALKIILMDAGIFFLLNFIVNVLKNLRNLYGLKFDMYQLVTEHHFREEGFIGKIYLAFLIFIVVFNLISIYKTLISFNSKDINKGTSGTSRWTTVLELDKQFKAVPLYPSSVENGENKTNYFVGKPGSIISRWRDNLYIDTQLCNNLWLGTTRSGKGELYVFPTIDVCSRAEKIENRPSLILFDPKLELYKSAKERLEKRGYKVRLVNLDDPTKSAGYNPLYIATQYFKNGQIEKAQQAAKTFAFGIYNSNNDMQEPIWKNTATDLFTALIIANISDCLKMDEELNKKRRAALKYKQENFEELEDDEEAKNIAIKRWEIFRKNITDDEDLFMRPEITCIPGDVEFKEINLNEKNINCFSVINFFKELCDRAALQADGDKSKMEKKAETMLDTYFNQRPPLDFAASLYSSIKSAGDRTKGSVFINMQSSLSIFLLNNVAKMTAENDIDFEEIGYGEQPVAIFMGIPSEDRSNHFLATTFVAQVYQYLFQLSKSRNGKLSRNVRFILDEFGNMPKIENFSGFVTVCLGIGMSFDIFIQSYNQLKNKYGDESDTIMENCSNRGYILNNGNESTEEFSKLLGNKTMIEVQRSGTRFQTSKSYMESTKEVRLMLPSDLQVLKEGETVLYRGAKRTDLSGASIRSYPVINEYLEGLYFRTKIIVFFKVIIRRLRKDRLYINDLEREAKFAEQYEREKSKLQSYLGTALLHRYQYMASDFPNPTEIKFDDICNESREHIDYSKRVNNPEAVAKYLSKKIADGDEQ